MTGRGAACLVLSLVGICGGAGVGPVVWDSPDPDCMGSMPLGNGDIGLNAWVEPSGDLVFYISKTDSWGDNGRLLKVGKVRVLLDPSPAGSEHEFRRELDVRTGVMRTIWSGADGETVLELWVDANRPVVCVSVSGPVVRTAVARIELWRTEPYELPSIETSDVLLDRSRPGDMHGPTVVEPDTLLEGIGDRIGWLHHNRKSVGPELTARIQGLSEFPRRDPLLHRTFGAVITVPGGRRLSETELQSPRGRSHRFEIFVRTEHPSTPASWLAAVEGDIGEAERTPFDARRRAHEAWWAAFDERSWVRVSANGLAVPRSVVPANGHVIRIGADQAGANRFSGAFGRVSVRHGVLSGSQIEALADTGPEDAFAFGDASVLFSGIPEAGAEIPGSAEADFADGVGIEAWVKPERLPPSGARIVDKITIGANDGLLLDTWPGNSLRLIIGDVILRVPDAVPADEWTHVAAVAEPSGSVRLYVNGALAAAEAGGVAGDDAEVVSQAYALQRYVNACAGRGRYPIKFNGSIFTVPHPGTPGDADYRRWGPGYWWQNTRLPYLGMCASGDFDLLDPLFRMYSDDNLELFRYRTRRYLGHGGVFIPECMYFWGDSFSETYGWTPFEEREDKLQASGWHKWEWVSGPELVFMMLDRYEYTDDGDFFRRRVGPMALEVLRFFDEHYPTGDDGKLVMHPSQALETWWDCTNPMPELAGLHAVTERLSGLPEDVVGEELRSLAAGVRGKLPTLPTRVVDGVEMLAPATRFEAKSNIENPELYAVFPFRLIAFDKPGAELGREALRHRWDRGHSGWRQDDIFMAYLGLADDARDGLVRRARTKHTASRFPVFWGPNYDWVPDQDHGGILLKTLQSMVMQTSGQKILLFPAWPRDWDVAFKLHAPGRTTVEGVLRNGEVERLTVTPESRRQDVVVLPVQ